ncbi:MAG TPA: cupin domain-containing protein [Stellaceae bacterium]|jgi:mannose-6-phosphate isomerase-like protein (cupin superfamily)|nr:cupin domain-containing protein [Stellaceae bacterium]
MLSAREIRQLSPEDKEKFHREAEARVKPFQFRIPEGTRPKEIVSLSKSDLQKINVQVIADGGENNLHYHTGSDTTWMVLRGKARFYGPGDVMIGEFAQHEGVFMPGGARYWFEKAGDEPLELLQMVAYERQPDGEKPQRINLDAHKDWMQEDQLKVYEKN